MTLLTISRRTQILALTVALITLTVSLSLVGWRTQAGHSGGQVTQPAVSHPTTAPATFTPTRMRSGAREVTGFSAHLPRQTKADAITPPAGLKPAETAAWLAMVQRQDSASKQTLESFYPANYGDPSVVQPSPPSWKTAR